MIDGIQVFLSISLFLDIVLALALYLSLSLSLSIRSDIIHYSTNLRIGVEAEIFSQPATFPTTGLDVTS